jgi:sugar O-acyltransferase (sialic acid O-acetyltransferase NeuD family)
MQCKDIVILGAGGLGREVLFLLTDINSKTNKYNILGFVDNSTDLQGQVINKYPVLGDDQWLLNRFEAINVVICVGNPHVRKRIVEKFSINKNIFFPNIIAGDVRYSDSIKMGKGCIICFSSILTVNITLGNFIIINFDCTVAHDSVLEDFVTLHPSVNVSGNVSIGMCTEVGTGTNIIQNISIGADSIIGAGSAVMRDVPPNCTVLGVPAKPIRLSSAP